MKSPTDTRSARLLAVATLALATLAPAAHALDWSDTSVGFRYGTRFAEPYIGDHIAKRAVNLTHANGYKWGSNFLNIDLMASDAKDSHAKEAYVVYRHTLDFGKVTGHDLSFGPVRGVGLTAGLDWNTKNDPGYGSRQRRWLLGPTVMMDVPGFLNLSVLAAWDSNRPAAGSPCNCRYKYDPQWVFNANWGLPLGGTGLSFEGYVNYYSRKGVDEYGTTTVPQLDVDVALMYDVGAAMGWGKKSLRVGVGYQYWRNKFGQPSSVPGSLARTPMLKVDMHF
ncbi:MAG: outer envelope protein [Ottowia sp.]|uniref:outer envelope protein n=1 Tax=Ottowia sp. TaxID=1898956 RepID=UPI0039E64646